MFGRTKKKEARRALRNKNLQVALARATASHFSKFAKTREEVPWDEIKAKARAVREECVPRLAALIDEFSEEATRAGAQVHRTATPEEALAVIDAILREKGAKLVAKSKSMVSEEIGLNRFLEGKGYRVVETDLGEWIVQLAGERPSHITAPAMHKTKEEVAELLSKHLGRPVAPDIREMVKIARGELRKVFIEADAGISGANLAVAESGTLVIVSNEGNARLVTTLPPVHIAIVTTEKFVATLEQATALLKALIIGSSGLKMTSYVSYITGPSKTTDIEKELVTGVHGPGDVHIVILDNGRLDISLDRDFKEILYCLKCGGCMLQCPVFQAVGGHVYSGKVYPGGIGALLTAATRSPAEIDALLDLCADCKKCEAFCPVGIPTSAILLKLKNWKGPTPFERLLSGVFRRKALADAGAGALAVLQKIWQKDGHLRKLPFAWAKGKRFPSLRPKKSAPALGERHGEKIYLFQGCLVKFFFPDIRDSVIKVLSRSGFDVVCPADQSCCGAPSYHLGDTDDVRRLMRANLRSFEKEKPDHILTVCPTGHSFLKKLYPELDEAAAPWAEKVHDFTEFMVKNGFLPKSEKAGGSGEILYHYPCHYLNDLKLKDEPLKILRDLGYDPKTENEPYSCCGFCGVFSMKNPEIAAKFWDDKKRKIEESGQTLIATDCPGCILQLKSGLADLEKKYTVVHTAELCAEKIR
ncbi:MAG: LUD domain-containing protein [Candidatus Aminicenantales bacterium]